MLHFGVERDKMSFEGKTVHGASITHQKNISSKSHSDVSEFSLTGENNTSERGRRRSVLG